MKILHIDMDDTICHYSKAYAIARERLPQIQFPQSQYGFYTALEPMEGAIDSINVLRDQYDVYILTRPSYKNPLCYTEKRVWIEKYFGLEFCDKLIICPNKGLVKGDYLIDDFLWPEFDGEQIHFGTTAFPNWSTVYSYLMNKQQYHETA
jgi:5'-nucleotidase